MHVAAMNLIADHKAGVVVNGTKLAAAYALMADYRAAQARASENLTTTSHPAEAA